MRLTMFAFAFGSVVGTVNAQQPLPTIPQLLTAEAKASRGCASNGDPAAVREQCTLRDRLSGRLAQAGYCWGRKGQTDQKKDWHPCGPDSIYADDVEAVGP